MYAYIGNKSKPISDYLHIRFTISAGNLVSTLEVISISYRLYHYLTQDEVKHVNTYMESES